MFLISDILVAFSHPLYLALFVPLYSTNTLSLSFWADGSLSL
jgi:hypothetical protein